MTSTPVRLDVLVLRGLQAFFELGDVALGLMLVFGPVVRTVFLFLRMNHLYLALSRNESLEIYSVLEVRWIIFVI